MQTCLLHIEINREEKYEVNMQGPGEENKIH